MVFCHTFNRLCPLDKYFEEHPEYFSEIKGQRVKERTQLCLTNPDVLKIVTENLLAGIRKDPTAKLFSVSQNTAERPLGIFEDISRSASSVDFLERATALWQKAEAAVQDSPAHSYNVRMRVRVEKKPGQEGDAFWAGVYDGANKRSRGGVERKTSAVGEGYNWYDVAEWVPESAHYFWIGPGRFDLKGGAESNIQALYIDKLELLRVG